MPERRASLDTPGDGPRSGRRASLAVVIVNWNSGPLLRRCLEALARQTRPADRVVVVDNASQDDSLLCLPFPSLETELIRLDGNEGFAAACNHALRRLSGFEWLAFLNPDAFPEPTWLAALAEAAARNPATAAFASQQRSDLDPGRLDGAGDVYHVSGLTWRRDHGRSASSGHVLEEEVFSPCAAAALFRRDAVIEAGGFDEAFFCYLEDVDLGFRLRLLGHRCLYVPDAVVRHVGSAVAGRHSAFTVYHGHRNLVWTFFKDMPAGLLALYLPQHLLANLASVLWFTLRGQARVILKAKWDALRGLPRVLRQRREVSRSRRVGPWALRRSMARGLGTPYRARVARWRSSV